MELAVQSPRAGTAWLSRVIQAGAGTTQHLWNAQARATARELLGGRTDAIGDPFVPSLVRYLGQAFPGRLEMVGRKLVNPAKPDPRQTWWDVGAEFDIEMSFAVIEVKTGTFESLYEQIPALQAHTDLPVVTYAPGIPPRRLDALCRLGYAIFDDARGLAGHLQSLSGASAHDLDAIDLPPELATRPPKLSSRQRRVAAMARVRAAAAQV